MFLLAGCAGSERPATILPAVEVPVSGETTPVGSDPTQDAADDPAIWAAPEAADASFQGNPVDALILGTDKKAGLYVYGMDGNSLQFLPDGLLNNVDLVPDGAGFVAAASDRGRMGVALYRYAGSGEVFPAGFIASDVVEPYGFCMGMWDGKIIAVLVAKDGDVRIYALTGSGTEMGGTEIDRFAVGSQSEGCAIDEAAGDLYIGEEEVGLWRYRLGDTANRTLIEPTEGDKLITDVEGVTVLVDGDTRYLLVSSQGDSAFAVWRLDGETPVYLNRFRVVAANGVDGVSGTDGIDALGGAAGPFPRGLVVTQDDDNEGQSQNFKLIDWRAILAAVEP
ncbi:phytase [Stakelama tenebrarum]|uniref:Phytase n=1 Tax=Stakelama tenebrarum TaxID=2711215 RepID=A0A6G6Y5Z9_9SPHN|nr:phytase [Sphingosinithalassobacter tenebrarum]QIG80006.1 phytase [Sphingosinithalassobacter tenebrarum]